MEALPTGAAVEPLDLEITIPKLRGVFHVYAVVPALLATAALIVVAPGGVERAAAAVYGAGLCALFGGSGLYHRWRWHPRWRPLLRRIDHSTIYLFIGACYTPVACSCCRARRAGRCWASCGAARWPGSSSAWPGSPRRAGCARPATSGWAGRR